VKFIVEIASTGGPWYLHRMNNWVREVGRADWFETREAAQMALAETRDSIKLPWRAQARVIEDPLAADRARLAAQRRR
jgi:hypothetical protein